MVLNHRNGLQQTYFVIVDFAINSLENNKTMEQKIRRPSISSHIAGMRAHGRSDGIQFHLQKVGLRVSFMEHVVGAMNAQHHGLL